METAKVIFNQIFHHHSSAKLTCKINYKSSRKCYGEKCGKIKRQSLMAGGHGQPL